jgi:hypothetical protein
MPPPNPLPPPIPQVTAPTAPPERWQPAGRLPVARRAGDVGSGASGRAKPRWIIGAVALGLAALVAVVALLTLGGDDDDDTPERAPATTASP